MLGKIRGVVRGGRTRGRTDELQAAREGGLDHLPCVDASFGLAEVEEHVWSKRVSCPSW